MVAQQTMVASATTEPADAVQPTAEVPTRPSCRNGLRQAAQALLVAWDGSASADALDEHFAALRAALAGLPARSSSANHSRSLRDTKRAQVLALLSRPCGVSGPEITEATGWAPHTVRAFLAGLTRNDMRVEVLERVRQVDPNGQGTNGSYSIYHLAGLAQT